MEEPGGKLFVVMEALTRGTKEHSASAIGEILHQDVVWHGVYEGQVCAGPTQVLEFLDRGFSRPWRITRLEATESGNDVVVTADGPDFLDNRPDGEILSRPTATLTFTFRDGLVEHIQGS